MLEDSSNRELVAAWRGGNHLAATVLVRRYMARLTSLANSRLSRKLARRLDAEDVVLSAWRSFFVATGCDQVNVPDDDNLWPLLVTMTLRKLSRQAAKHSAERRSIHAESEFSGEVDWPSIAARDPTPDEAAAVTDEVEQLMSDLSAIDRDILCRRLQGYQHAAIAEAVGCSERTVRRSLQRIREQYATKADCHRSEDDIAMNSVPIDSVSSGKTTRSTTRGSSYEGHGDRAHASDSTDQSTHSELKASAVPAVEADEVTLHRLIGQGAFGKVYQATRKADGATVAIKYLKRSLWRNQQATQQLINEVKTVSALSHPGIIKHYGWGRTRRGAVFIVMEWIDGEILQEWTRRAQPSISKVVQCGREICDALTTAHQVGVIHADLSPSNIMRRRDGRFVLMDFGFSRRLSNPESAFHAGTPGFLAPEQLSDAFGMVSQRTDVFGLGAVLYFLLTGRKPNDGQDLTATIAQTLSSRPVERLSVVRPDVQPDLNQLIADCINKEPSARPESIDYVIERLNLTQFNHT